MSKVSVRKIGNKYQYRFEITKINGKRRWQEKCGYTTQSDALMAGIEAQNRYFERCECYRGDRK